MVCDSETKSESVWGAAHYALDHSLWRSRRLSACADSQAAYGGSQRAREPPDNNHVGGLEADAPAPEL